MKIKNSLLQRQAHCSALQERKAHSTHQVHALSLLKDINNISNKAIKKLQSTSLRKKCSLAVTCRDFKKFFNNFIPN
ncbi:MAG: hypothetical protein ACRDDW_07790 [Candidatus Rhabdochlamydia sp.]